MKHALSLVAAAAVLAATLPAAAQVTAAESIAAADRAAYERDAASIKAMAGDYSVKFDFKETTPFVADYKPIPPKVSGGEEVVRVIEDKPGFISLQHILVVGDAKAPVVVKHWRQDWTWQPASVLTYEGQGHWKTTPVSAAERKGAWSQTVWQTDDSPRYGGVGRWSYEDGATRWVSGRTWRPLARRDATRHPVYDRYDAINRHALTPDGWVHEQDNSKIGSRDGKLVTFVHEDGVNTYRRNADFPVKAATDYWAKTQGYWAEVRKMWDGAIAVGHGVAVEEEADAGAVTGPALMGLADAIAEGDTPEAAAIANARKVIDDATHGRKVGG